MKGLKRRKESNKAGCNGEKQVWKERKAKGDGRKKT